MRSSAITPSRPTSNAKDLGRPNATELGARALTLLVAAADRARDRFDQHAAWKLYERATAIADGIGADVTTRAHARGYALLGRLQFVPADESADQALDEAIALARSAGPSRVLVTLLDWQARDAFNRKGDAERAKQIAAELPDLARATSDADLLAETLGTCGLLAYWWNDRAGEEQFYLAAVEAGRRGGRARSIELPLRRLAIRARRFEGDYQRGAEYDRQLEEAPAGTSLVERYREERIVAMSAYECGDFAVSLEHAANALAGTRELGAPFQIAFDEWHLGEALLEIEGQDARAREALEHGAETMERLQYRGQIPELRARAAIACLRVGDREAARAHVAAAKAAVLPLDVESRRITMQAEAQLLAADGDVRAAERVLRDELARIEPTGYGFELALLRKALGEILLAAERPAEARDELSKARAFFRDPLSHGWQERIDALIARCEARASSP